MGNSHSSLTIRRSPYKKDGPGSTASRTRFGCVSGNFCAGSTLSLPSAGTQQTLHERSIHEKQSFQESITASELSIDPTGLDSMGVAYHAFLRHFPEYQLTTIIDHLRQTEFSRLQLTGETYVDYMGSSLYPESLVNTHTRFLQTRIMGNTHSISNSSRVSSISANEARATILSYFDATPDYTVIFTPNATGALKLVGESYPFGEDSAFVLSADSHNSVHGIRRFASHRGAKIYYIDSTRRGGFEEAVAQNTLLSHRPEPGHAAPSLFALTGQSNISNSKNSLAVAEYAMSLGFHVLLDAAALASTSTFSLSRVPVDAVAVSFYKMFGFPTGVGALIVKKSFLAQLERPWFAGGNVDLVQVPGPLVTLVPELHEQFEDGTINFLMLPAITEGLRFLSKYQPYLPLRLSCLMHFLTQSLSRLRHDTTGMPVVQILSRLPLKRLRSIGEEADTGSTVSLLFLSPDGTMLPNSFVDFAASVRNISLRTGCMCNPGGAAALLGLQEHMDALHCGMTRKELEGIVGHEVGVVRISLGLVSSFQDVWNVLQFAASIGNETARGYLWQKWLESDMSEIGQAL